MKNSKIAAMILVLLIAGFGVLIYRDHQVSSEDQEPIRMAFIGPLTGDGAAWGEIEWNTIQLAADEINQNGGIRGRKIEVVAEDGKCTGKDALSAAKKLVEVDEVKILLVSCSQEILPIAPYVEQKKVLALTSYASASSITNAGDYIFRNSYSNKDMGRKMAEIAIAHGVRAGVIGGVDEFSSDLGQIFKEEYIARGGSIVAEENLQGDVKDFRSPVAKVLGARPDVVIVNPYSVPSGLAIITQVRQQGFNGQLVGNFFGGSREVQQAPEAQGMLYVSDPVFAESALKKTVFDAYEKKYGMTPDLPWPVGARYDAMYFLKQAIEEVGDNPTAIKDYLYRMPPFTGILGTYTFDRNGDITNVKPSVARIQDFKSVSAE